MSRTRAWAKGSRLLAGLVILALAGAAWYLLRTPPLPVELATVRRGPMAVSITELGETRVKDLYTIASPVTGELLRIPFKPGTAVVAGRTILAEVQPVQPGPIDSRSYAQTQASIAGLEAQHAAARARVREARAAAGLASADFERMGKLAASGFVTRARLDQARAELLRSRAAVTEAAEAEDAARHAVEAAQAGLGNGGAGRRGPVTRITAPVSGTVLRVLEESRRPVAAGTALLEIGDPGRLEIVVDLLTEDAVRLRPGATATVDPGGGAAPLPALVRLVEPYGFTKVSALGVEEQRVNVRLDFAALRPASQPLGHGYRVTVAIRLWSADDVVQVPLGALFRGADGWAIYVVDAGGRSRLHGVAIGHRNDDVAEVLGGLAPGETIVLHPSDKLVDGRLVSGIY
jgi:HlyD family secretion protein